MDGFTLSDIQEGNEILDVMAPLPSMPVKQITDSNFDPSANIGSDEALQSLMDTILGLPCKITALL